MMRTNFYFINVFRAVGLMCLGLLTTNQLQAQSCNVVSKISGDTLYCPGDSVQLTVPKSNGGSKTLTSTTAGGNGQNGNMFMIEAKDNITITSFDVSPQSTTAQDYAIYYKMGNFTNSLTDSSDWTALGRYPNVNPATSGLTRIDLHKSLFINAGDSVSFYISITSNTIMNYSTGSSVYASYATNSELIFYEGTGKQWPFNATFPGTTQWSTSSRIWNGNINYKTTPTQALWSTGDTTAGIWVSPNQRTQYWAILSSRLNTSCNDTDTVFVSPQRVTVQDVPDTSFCAGTDVVIDGGIAPSGSKYSWDPSGRSSGRYVNYNTPGNKYLQLTTKLGCHFYDSFTISEIATPDPKLGNDTTFCDGNTLTLDAGQFNSNASYEWQDNSTGRTYSVSSSGTYMVTVTQTGCVGMDTIEVTVNANPSLNLPAFAAVCAGDSMMVDAGDHGMNTMYMWSTGDMARSIYLDSTAKYGVMVTDNNGCSSTDSVDFTVNALPVVDLGGDSTLCSAETPATLDAGDFGNGTQYMWNGTSGSQTWDVTATGNYRLVVTDPNGCVGSDNVRYTVNPSPMIPAAITDTDSFDLCTGEELKIDLGSMNANNTIVWNADTVSQTFIVNAGGMYNLAVYNKFDCIDTQTVEVIDRALPVVDLGEDDEVCRDDSFMLDAGDHTTYRWSTTETSPVIYVGPGTFTVTVSNDYGCNTTDRITISRAPNAFANFTGQNQGEFRIKFNNFSTDADSYEWDFGDGETSTNDAENFIYTYDSEGEKTVSLTATNECGSHTATKTISVVPASLEAPVSKSFSVYPNPNQGTFNIQMENGFDNVIMEVVGMDGKVVAQERIGSVSEGSTFQVQMPANAQSGVYMLRFNADGQLGTIMINVQ